MARVFLSSCKNKAFYPEASAKLKDYLIDGGYIDEYAGCCKPGGPKHRDLEPGADAIVLCHTCHAIVEEHEPVATVTPVFDIILNDPAFPFPDYGGEAITVQDCWRARGRHDIHDAVRALLRKMNMEPVELEENRDESRFCGLTLLNKLPAQMAELAPKRYGSLEPGLFEPRPLDEQMRMMQEQVSRIATPRVVSYCFACDGGLQRGGADSVALLDLLFGTV